MSKSKYFYLIHKHSPKNSQIYHSSYTNGNIFANAQTSSDYFPTCPAENPFTILNKKTVKKQLVTISEGQLELNQRKTNPVDRKIIKQQTYKMSYTPVQKLAKINKSYTQRSKKISQQKQSNTINERYYYSSKKLKSIQNENEQKYDKKIYRFLYQKAMSNEIGYNQDLKTKLGDQYFYNIVRNRYKQQILPQSNYIYTIKNQLNPINIKFVNYLKKLHPDIIIRNKLKIKGINRGRVATQGDSKQVSSHHVENQEKLQRKYSHAKGNSEMKTNTSVQY